MANKIYDVDDFDAFYSDMIKMEAMYEQEYYCIDDEAYTEEVREMQELIKFNTEFKRRGSPLPVIEAWFHGDI